MWKSRRIFFERERGYERERVWKIGFYFLPGIKPPGIKPPYLYRINLLCFITTLKFAIALLGTLSYLYIMVSICNNSNKILKYFEHSYNCQDCLE